jgi:hypothetical protein
MAISFTGVDGVMGNKRYAHGTVTLTDQASGAVQIPGIAYIDAATVAPGSVWAGATYSVGINQGSGATTIAGMLHIASATSSDVFSVSVYGR